MGLRRTLKAILEKLGQSKARNIGVILYSLAIVYTFLTAPTYEYAVENAFLGLVLIAMLFFPDIYEHYHR